MSSAIDEVGDTSALQLQPVFSVQLHYVVLSALCHSLYTCAFVAALYYIFNSSRAISKRKRILAACVVTFMWSTQTVLLVEDWQALHDLFIVHGISLESKSNYWLSTGTSVAALLSYDLLQGLNIVLADVILIWRCWVLYGSSWKTVSALAACLVLEIVSASVLLFFETKLESVFTPEEATWIFIYYSSTVLTNCLCTFLIIYRIVRISGFVASLRTYHGIIEMLVESALMYSLSYTAFLAVFGYEFSSPNSDVNPTYSLYPAIISSSITGIAPTLIIARVMAGKARPDDSWTRSSLPHLRSNMRSLRESLHFASAPNTELSTTGEDVLEEGGVTSDHEVEPETTEAKGEEPP